ncbi:MAG TPA: PaaI family thioesterase [Hyphomicrobiaceae bacterium]|nr:PaaI family thioesterase [Hyphomicrobiaceae bacterium]
MPLTDEQIRAALADQSRQPPSARLLGFELLDFSVAEKWAEMAFTPRPEFANPAGAVQGGFVCAMLDDAMAIAAVISQGFGIIVPTLQLSISYVRPTPIERVIARGELVRIGSSTAQMQGSLRQADGTLLATATAAAAVRPFPKR